MKNVFLWGNPGLNPGLIIDQPKHTGIVVSTCFLQLLEHSKSKSKSLSCNACLVNPEPVGHWAAITVPYTVEQSHNNHGWN